MSPRVDSRFCLWITPCLWRGLANRSLSILLHTTKLHCLSYKAQLRRISQARKVRGRPCQSFPCRGFAEATVVCKGMRWNGARRPMMKCTEKNMRTILCGMPQCPGAPDGGSLPSTCVASAADMPGGGGGGWTGDTPWKLAGTPSPLTWTTYYNCHERATLKGLSGVQKCFNICSKMPCNTPYTGGPSTSRKAVCLIHCATKPQCKGTSDSLP